MTIKEFEKQLQKIDKRLSIRPSKFPDMNGVWFLNSFLFGIPSENIYEHRNEAYRNADGFVHRTTFEAEGMAKMMIKQMEDDTDLRELMLEDEKTLANKLK